MKDPDLRDYAAWLYRERYQDSTVVVTLRNLKLVFEAGRITSDNAIPHVRRYLRFVKETRKNPLGGAFVSQMRKLGIEPSAEIEKHGQRSKKLLDLASWSKLKDKLRRGEETDLLIVAFMNSGMRISAFLQLRADEITEEITDKISRTWIQKAGGSRQLYRLLCDTERCAYARMLRRLQEVYGSKVDLDTLYKTFQHRAEERAIAAAAE